MGKSIINPTIDGINYNAAHIATKTKAKFISENDKHPHYAKLSKAQRETYLGKVWDACKQAADPEPKPE